MTSVNTNYGALMALQSLTKTNTELGEVQGRITTGLKVASAKDNGAIFAIAEGQRARVGALAAVNGGIDRAKSAIDFGVQAGEAVNDILKQMRDKAQEAAGTGLASSDRSKLQTDFQKLSDQIDQIVSAASYNGVNLANGNGGVNLSVVTSDQSSALPASFTVASRLGAGFTDVTANQRLLSGSTLVTAVDTEYEAGDGLSFTQGGNVYSVTFDAGDTLNDLATKINNATGGAISARFDSTRGELVYSSNSTFSVAYTNGNATTAAPSAADLAFLAGGTTAQQLSTATAGAQTTVASQYGSGTLGSSTTVTAADFTRSTLGIGSLDISGATSAGANTAVTAIDTALNTLRNSLSSLGSQSKALDVQKTFLGKLSDTLTASIGNLVDADLAKESARLQSLQVKQQLGGQALSIANQTPQILLSFFR